MKIMLGALPTYAMVRLSQPFLAADHPLKHVTLPQWWKGQTPICRAFDVILLALVFPLGLAVVTLAGWR